MDEVPDRGIPGLEAAGGELGHQSAQREVSLPNPLPEPDLMLIPDRLRLVTAHLARRHAAGFSEPPNPRDRRAHADAEAQRRLVAGQTLLHNSRDDTRAQIHR